MLKIRSQSTREEQCPQSNGWARLSNPNDTIKSAVFLEKANKSTVDIRTSGCEGKWA